MQVIVWRTVSEMTCNVSSGTLNLTHSLTFDGSGKADVIYSSEHGADCLRLIVANPQHVHSVADLDPRLRCQLAILGSLQRRHECVGITELLQIQFLPAPSNATSSH